MLANRTILITGAYSGVGFASAQACIKASAKVIVHARTKEDLDGALAKLGADAAGVHGDLIEPGMPARIVQQAAEKFGRLDGLVNNAASVSRSTIETIDADSLAKMFAINVSAPLLLIQAALPHLEAGRDSAIVNIGSINAYTGATKLLAYSASKGALMTATRNLGDALAARGVRVNQINLGWTWTENEHKVQIAEGQPDNWADLAPKSLVPRGKLTQQEEAASHVVFWLSSASAPANGQVYELEQFPLIGRYIAPMPSPGGAD
jgi:NAD(P)-dependent dehydrogenase (short-subunit alcohol dehydrogenase family)